MSSNDFLKAADACWCVEPSPHVAFIQDAAHYYEHLHEALLHARRSIYIAGWDVSSRVELLRGGAEADHPTTLADYLGWLTARNPDLHVHILNWDFSMIYAPEREVLPIFSMWQRMERVRLWMDSAHPLGASHHQKFVVVDDALAFAGGIDLTSNRWDTPEHKPDDPDRVDPDGNGFGPFHDLQMAVDGPAAARLGELFRIRWRRATGQTLEPPVQRDEPVWPDGLEAWAEDVEVCMARTEAPHAGREGVHEVRAQMLGAIACARERLYIENQYLGSTEVQDALLEHLRAETGPEIVIVLPENASNWLARESLDRIRDGILRTLIEADEHGRLGVYYPAAPDGEAIYVHSKLLIADDEVLVLGSANLVNRSFGLDTELNLAVDASEHDGLRRACRRFRCALLGEFLGMEPDAVDAALDEDPSMHALIRSRADRQPRLEPFDPEVLAQTPEEPLIPKKLADPAEPVDPQYVVDRLFNRRMVGGATQLAGGKTARAIVLFVLAVALFAAWRYTPLSEWLSLARMAHWGEAVRDDALAPLYVVGAFVAGGALMVPVTLMVVAVALLFDPLAAFTYSLAGSLLSAGAMYLLGGALGREAVRSFGGVRINRLSRGLSENGLWAVAVARNLPVAPFTVVNLLAGAMGLGFGAYMGGTAIGMAPGILLIGLTSDALARGIADSNGVMIVVGLALATVFVSLGWLARKLRLRRGKTGDDA